MERNCITFIEPQIPCVDVPHFTVQAEIDVTDSLNYIFRCAINKKNVKTTEIIKFGPKKHSFSNLLFFFFLTLKASKTICKNTYTIE